MSAADGEMFDHTAEHKVAKQRGRFAIWAWSPIIVLRVALVATYLLYIYAALIAFRSGVPIFENTTPHGWRIVWSTILGVSAIIAAVGSLDDRWRHWEKWASMCVSAMMASYIIALNMAGYLNGDLARQFVGVISLIAAVLPITRFVYLAAQSGKKHVDSR
jgi:hypothetical protein